MPAEEAALARGVLLEGPLHLVELGHLGPR